MPAVVLHPRRERSLLRRHPWIFSGAVARIDGEVHSGATVDVLSSAGEFVARAAYSPHSQIRARVWTYHNEPVDRDFFCQRLRAAFRLRDKLELTANTDALRLVNAESDGIPGLVLDRYSDTLVMQCLTAGADQWRDMLADLALQETGLQRLYERSDADVRKLEGLPPRVGFIHNADLAGSQPPETRIRIQEHGLKFLIDIESGHKTGFYLDQRDNRLAAQRLAQGREVLDCFCYSGGFTLNALAGGAKSVVAIDSSADALSLAKQNLALNDLPAENTEFLEGDVFYVLRRFRDAARSFDMVILDPPKFAPTAAHAEKAARGYKDINLLAFKLLRPGGVLVTFSCSAGVDAALFQKIVASAALDAGVDARIISRLGQAPDHAVSLSFPEGTYLKGLVCYKAS